MHVIPACVVRSRAVFALSVREGWCLPSFFRRSLHTVIAVVTSSDNNSFQGRGVSGIGVSGDSA